MQHVTRQVLQVKKQQHQGHEEAMLRAMRGQLACLQEASLMAVGSQGSKGPILKVLWQEEKYQAKAFVRVLRKQQKSQEGSSVAVKLLQHQEKQESDSRVC